MEYNEFVARSVERLNKYNFGYQIKIMWRIVLNILWVMVCEELLTIEEALSLIKEDK